jgi:hypothetical protein
VLVVEELRRRTLVNEWIREEGEWMKEEREEK